MATRIFCDHCGNTITTPNVFCYGPCPEVQEAVYPIHQGAGAAGVGGVGGAAGPGIALGVGQRHQSTWVSATAVSVAQPSTSQLIKVDLCNTCVSIWMERVRNLTKASDPDA